MDPVTTAKLQPSWPSLRALGQRFVCVLVSSTVASSCATVNGIHANTPKGKGSQETFVQSTADLVLDSVDEADPEQGKVVAMAEILQQLFGSSTLSYTASHLSLYVVQILLLVGESVGQSL